MHAFTLSRLFFLFCFPSPSSNSVFLFWLQTLELFVGNDKSLGDGTLTYSLHAALVHEFAFLRHPDLGHDLSLIAQYGVEAMVARTRYASGL